MPGPRDVESVVADYLSQFASADPGGPGPDAAGLLRWLADEGWVVVAAPPPGREP